MKALLVFLFAQTVFAAPLIQIESGGHEPVVHLAAKKLVSGLASAGSTFKDLSEPKASVETIGSASLVRLKPNGHLAALTAAHVVAGSRPWIEFDGEKVYPKAIYIDNDNDVAILDLGVRKKKEAALEFGPLVFQASSQPAVMTNQLTVGPKFMKAIEDDQIPLAMIAYYFPGHALGFALRPWVDPGVESAYTRAVVHAPIVSQNESGSMVRVFTKITSGASGSAVLDLRQKTVAGLVVQSHYYFSETYLVSPSVLTENLNQFLKGRRGSKSATTWKMNQHLTYRVFEDGTEEASFTTRPTSGVLGQPGNGVIGQPGRDSKFQPWSEDPRSVFDFFKIEPGMIWKHQNVIGLKVKTKATEEWPAEFTLLAEPEALRFLKAHNFEVIGVDSKVNFADVLRARLGGESKLKPVYGPSAVANDFELKPAKPGDLSVEISKNDEIHVHVATFSKMDRTTWQLVPDEIEFTLNAHGALGKDTQFLPVIATKGLKSGETYYVDLRQFFFTDYSQLARPMNDWSKENAPFDPKRMDLKQQIETIGFSARNSVSGAEFSYGFTKAQ